MNRWQASVREFHEAMDLVVNERPIPPADGLIWLRAELVDEEALELVQALVFETLPQIAKEMADVIYVVLGTAVSLGIDLDPVFAAVHESNMAKTTGPVRPDGKRMKPAGWVPPDIGTVLAAQGAA